MERLCAIPGGSSAGRSLHSPFFSTLFPIVCVVTGLSGAAYADSNLSSQESPFVVAAERALPAVVNISMEKRVTAAGRREQGPFDELFREFFRGLPGVPSLPFEVPSSALGSGVIVSPDGYIVTNNHVVSGYDRFIVRLNDGTEFRGSDVRIVGADPQTDLAVLKVNANRPLPAIDYADSDSLRIGEWAIAIGNPFGLQSTLTVGVISATGRSGIPLPEGPSRQDFIQTDASINPGNSGGALVNVRGELIGINTAIRSPVGASVGIGFAVPVRIVRQVAAQLIARGRVVRGYLGIRPQEVTRAIRSAMALSDTGGVLVSQVLENTPAARAGIKGGDLIVEVNRNRITGVNQFRELIASFAPGTRVELVIVRNGRRLTKQVELTEFPQEQAIGEKQPEERRPWLGLYVREMTEAERSQQNADLGVLVERVEGGSPADDAGVVPGDVILKVGDREIRGLRDFQLAERSFSGTDRAVLLYIKRGNERLFIAVEPAR